MNKQELKWLASATGEKGFTSCLFFTKDNVTATDGKRLHRVDTDSYSGDMEILSIPATTINAITKKMGVNDDFKLSVDNETVTFTIIKVKGWNQPVETHTTESLPEQQTAPDFKRVIPSENDFYDYKETDMTSWKQLFESFPLAKPIKDKRYILNLNGSIKLEYGTKHILHANLTIELENIELPEIGLDPFYLIDMLSGIESWDTTTIHYNNQLKPLEFKSGNKMAVLMPMRMF